MFADTTGAADTTVSANAEAVGVPTLHAGRRLKHGGCEAQPTSLPPIDPPAITSGASVRAGSCLASRFQRRDLKISIDLNR